MSDFSINLKAHFDKLTEALLNETRSGEELNFSLNAEETNYIRFNRSLVRQATHVHQKLLSMQFHNNNRSVKLESTLSGVFKSDLTLFKELLSRARQEVEVIPEDPFQVPLNNQGKSEKDHQGELAPFRQICEEVKNETSDSDFVGLYAGGPVIRASRNSCGQSHWFSNQSFFMDYSLFTKNLDGENKAVKGNYSGSHWNPDLFSKNLAQSKNQISLLKKKSVPIQPGKYKVYLGPGAVSDICDMFSRNALSYSSYRQGHCAFTKLFEKQLSLSSKFTLQENFTLGLSPQFNSLGELAPNQIPLITNGVLQNMLVSARAAKEFGVPSNGAESGKFDGEFLRSPEIFPGRLPEAKVLSELDTGLYLSNLHYLNWSDVMQARITGMTRYACFWVKNGEIVGPIKDLRFDNSLFSVLGTNLIDLTQEQHLDLSVFTYFQRSLGGKKIPGILTDNFMFTL